MFIELQGRALRDDLYIFSNAWKIIVCVRVVPCVADSRSLSLTHAQILIISGQPWTREIAHRLSDAFVMIILPLLVVWSKTIHNQRSPLEAHINKVILPCLGLAYAVCGVIPMSRRSRPMTAT